MFTPYITKKMFYLINGKNVKNCESIKFVTILRAWKAVYRFFCPTRYIVHNEESNNRGYLEKKILLYL